MADGNASGTTPPCSASSFAAALHDPGLGLAPGPGGTPIEWRALALTPRSRFVVARGWLVRVEPSALPLFGHDGVRPGPVVRWGAPPALRWPSAPGAAGYAFEASLDGFANVHFTTLDERLLADPAFEIPSALWKELPPGSVCGWRGLAVFPTRRDVVRAKARSCGIRARRGKPLK